MYVAVDEQQQHPEQYNYRNISSSSSSTTSGKLDFKNLGTAVGISFMSCLLFCLEAELLAFEVYGPPYWIFFHFLFGHTIFQSIRMES